MLSNGSVRSGQAHGGFKPNINRYIFMYRKDEVAMTNFNFNLNSMTSEELYTLQIKITPELRRRTRSEVESVTTAEPVSEVKSAPKKADAEEFGAVIRDGKIVHTAPRFISKGQRYALRMAVKAAGGQQVHEGEVYSTLKSNDKFVEVFEFKTMKAAKTFMAEQREYFAHKKG